MNHAPHLRAEDRPDFGRTLDDALRDSTILAALREHQHTGLNAEQLRTKALFDQDVIAEAALAEYLHYLGLRDGLRVGLREAPAQAVERPRPKGRPGPQTTSELLAQLSSPGGGGLWPVLTVLVPMLSVGAAILLLLTGYILTDADTGVSYGRSVVLSGWAAVAVAAVSLVIGLVGLVLTAVRDSAAGPAGEDPELRAGVAEARAAWQHALRERGLLPYLLANLDSDPALAPRPPSRRPTAAPEFSSPGYTSAAYGSPGFSSPGVEGVTDPEGREPRPTEFSSPGYSPPGFTGPDEV
ncbi:hypothetical protein P3T37_007089 [Kitasatospora sp. MAA4]|uniref:hypothetical protein n=1 Tax=Kitasatospora sp. MAA4 TaxID=3035093 RepID=UPI002476BAFC|nr:hypothetical protein [Kitasatospora sp. MAA4]MDH6137656.1 hypothetical protein [Kitasatospora sp. MAA4]